ncbi:MAG: hypothetical protein OXG85_06760 [Chloroflexi bacterium]|nr:hypothetical protein [Chloroflexota bacterium]
MPFEYPQEIRDQQAKVKREIEKLNRMRRDHLIATGQMPTATDLAVFLKENRSDAKPAAIQKNTRPT